MKTRRFVVLPYSLHGDHIPHLMGRIVLDPLNPLRRFVPNPDDGAGFNPEDVVPTLCPPPVVYHNHTEVIRAGSSAKLRARLSDYLGFEIGTSASSSVALRAGVVRRYEMADHGAVFRRFMAHDGFRGLIEGILDEAKGGEALIVVGFYTSEKTRWAALRTGGREHGADLQIPVGAVVGLPVGVDPGLGGSKGSSVEHGFEGEVEGEEIFAIAYDVIKKKHSLDRTARRWVSSTPVLGDELRVQAGHLAMGQDSDEELEYDSEPGSDDAEMHYILGGDIQQWTSGTGEVEDYIEL